MSRPPVDYIERTRSSTACSGTRRTRGSTTRTILRSSPSRSRSRSRGSVSSRPGASTARDRSRFTTGTTSSYRLVPRDCEVSELRATHFAYDVTDARIRPERGVPAGDAPRGGSRRRHRGGCSRTPARSWAESTRRARCVNLLAPALAGRMERRRGRCRAARTGLTGVPSVRGIDCTRDRGPRDPHDLHVERVLDHRRRPSSPRRVPGLPARPRTAGKALRSRRCNAGCCATRWTRSSPSTLRGRSGGCRTVGPRTTPGRTP